MKSKSYEQLQGQIREQFQSAYKQKIKTMYSMFELKYQSLQDSILSVYDRIKKDQLWSTMLNDRTSSIHIEDRVKEIFNQVVAQQRELIFKKMGMQITNLKFQNQELSRTMKRLKESTSHMQQQFYTERQTIEQAKNTVHDELKKMKEENYHMKADKNIKEKEFEEFKMKFQEINEENYQLKALLNNLRENREETMAQTKQLQFYRNQIKSLQGQVQNLKSLLTENQEKFQRKYLNKKKDFKQKIEQYKTVINQMRNDRIKNQISLKQMEEVQIQADPQKKMHILVREHEKKLSELRNAKEREKVQIQRKYQYKLKETQNYFQKTLQNKVMEIEQNTADFFQKMKDEGSSLEKKLQFYEQNFISLGQFQEEISKREELMMIMKRKLEEFESSAEVFSKNEEILLSKLKDSQNIAFQFKQRICQLQTLNKELANKYKNYEQSNNILKINQKKIKDQFDEYERLIKKTREENEDLRRNIINLQEIKTQNDNSLREKDRKLKEIAEQFESLSKKYKKTQQNLDSITREKQSLLYDSKQLKKELTNLQYKLKDQEMTSTLNHSSMDSKYSNLQQDLKEKTTLLTQLQKKYNETSMQYQQEKSKNYEIENQLRKFEMENKFLKQNIEMQKKEQHNYMEEMKKNINEKNLKIQKMNQDIQNKIRLIRTSEYEKNNEKDRLYNENKSLRGKLKNMYKVVMMKLQNVRKESYLIKDFLVSRQTILSNDSAIMLSTFNKQLSHLSANLDKQSQLSSKRLKEELTIFFKNESKLQKNDYQDNIRRILEKQENQKQILRQQIKEKEDKIQQMTREAKSNQLQVKKSKEQYKNIQRQCQLALNRNEQLKQHHELKLKELIKEMKEQRELILKEYSDKKSQLQNEICQLLSSLKQLKTQIQLIQTRHQEQKLVINSQLRTVKEQEEAIQKIAHQKEAQMQKYLVSNQALEQSKKGLENQIRGYADTLNRKIQLIHELQLKENQITGENSLIKNKCERMTEEVSELRRKLAQREDELEENQKSKMKIENQLKDIKGALNRSNKNNQIRALNAMSMETLQLSQKVNEMRKCSTFLDSKTPLRS